MEACARPGQHRQSCFGMVLRMVLQPKSGFRKLRCLMCAVATAKPEATMCGGLGIQGFQEEAKSQNALGKCSVSTTMTAFQGFHSLPSSRLLLPQLLRTSCSFPSLTWTGYGDGYSGPVSWSLQSPSSLPLFTRLLHPGSPTGHRLSFNEGHYYSSDASCLFGIP